MECDEPTTNYLYWVTQDELNMRFNDGKPFSECAHIDETKETSDGSQVNKWIDPDLSFELSDHSAQDDMSKNEVQFEDDFLEIENSPDIKEDSYETGDIVMEETSDCSTGSSTRPEKPLERAFEQLDMKEANDY